MARKKYQVLVIPIIKKNNIFFCIFKRKKSGIWQFISGGGEEEDNSIDDTAKRELFEESNIKDYHWLLRLKTCCSISVEFFPTHRKEWEADTFVIPEYAYAALLKESEIKLSSEHDEYRWVEYDEAKEMLNYDSNKVAMWEIKNLIDIGVCNV